MEEVWLCYVRYEDSFLPGPDAWRGEESRGEDMRGEERREEEVEEAEAPIPQPYALVTVRPIALKADTADRCRQVVSRLLIKSQGAQLCT